MKLKEAIYEALKKIEGTTTTCYISCDWNDPEDGWIDDAILGTSSRLHPEYADTKFFFPIEGWTIENERSFLSQEDAEALPEIEKLAPKNMKRPVYCTDLGDWIEYDDWVENASEMYTENFDIDQIEQEFESEKEARGNEE